MSGIFLSEPGLVCCAGQNKDELFTSCIKGDQSGFARQELSGGESFFTGQITRELPAPRLSLSEPVCYAADTRIVKIIDAALEQIRPLIEKALADYGPEKIGVCYGTCDNGSQASLAAHKVFLDTAAFPADFSLRYQSAAFAAEIIARKFGIKGPVFTVATACSSGASAIIKGAELIRAGVCDAVIAGGADVVSDTVLMGFASLEALSANITNPFSKNRDGINLGEGAAFFLLDSKNKSGVALLGAGESADAYHITAPGPDGDGPAMAMKAALKSAGLQPEHIDYVNLHGTGTPLNDKAESLAMQEVFGDKQPPASSTKPITGHTLGAAGALEAAVCWMALTQKQGLPVHCWDGMQDDMPKLLLVSKDNAAFDTKPLICMSNSFGFGGCNVSLILGSKEP